MILPATAALGTMHGKAAAIAPPLSRIGIAVIVPDGLDTDRFGTFTGEVPRPGTMRDAARHKARAASDMTGLSIGLASEGAYGLNPLVPVLARGQELLLWLDSRSGHEIVETLTDDRPMYDQTVVRSDKDVQDFASRIGFPDTAIVVSPAEQPDQPVAKGVRDVSHLDLAIKQAARTGPVLLRTDMRAHMNARRMAVIADLAERFAQRLTQSCPSCAAPGFGHLRHDAGLACSWCGGPTLLSRGSIEGCTACGTEILVPRPDGLLEADPAHCPACNP